MPSRSIRLPPRVAVWAALLSLAVACRSGEAPAREAPRRYTVRGEIVRMPEAGGPRQLLVRHEPIHDFRDGSGSVVGMDSMIMPFDLSPAVSLGGLGAGDAVEASVAVGFSSPLLRIESLKKLPPGTPLRFGKAEPKDARH